MVLAIVVMAVIGARTGQPVTVVLFAAVLAMISNLSVNEPELVRLRTTTALMLAPAAASTAIGTLLAPYHLVADAVFVVVTIAAVYVRRFGPRGFALGMAAFMPYFFTQFLQASPTQLPWLLLAVAVGIGSTFLLRGVVFAERQDRTVARQLRAFRAHLHALFGAVGVLLAADADDVADAQQAVGRRRARLNDTALLLADALDRTRTTGTADDRAGDAAEPDADALVLHVIDAELSAERLAVAASRLVQAAPPIDHEARRTLVDGLNGLEAATATGTPPAMVPALLDGARRSVAALAGERRGHGDRAQRVGFAVIRFADAQDALDRGDRPDPAEADERDRAADPGRPVERGTEPAPDEAAAEQPQGLQLTTRQAVQVGVAMSLAIVLGELVSPARWYWAAITAFVVFSGTTSRGDVLSRGAQRIIGTIGGVVAGMGLALLVSGQVYPTLVLLFACGFLALYLVRVSPVLMAFWITAVLALLYGLLGQFSAATLVLRVEETAVGAAVGVLAGYFVLPKRTREAFDDALDELVDAVDTVLGASVDRIRGREPGTPPADAAHTLHDALATLRARAVPLDSPLPWRRGRSSYQHTVRVLSAVDYYARSLARISDTLEAPRWHSLDAAADRVRSDLDALRLALLRRAGPPVESAEQLVDAAEADAAHLAPPETRKDLLDVARMLRRIDQAVAALATGLGRVPAQAGQVEPFTQSSTN